MHPMIIRGLNKVQQEIQEQLMQTYELFDNRNKGYIDHNGLAEAMKMLGYGLDKKQIQELLSQIASGEGRSTVTREDFKKFMTARMDYRDDSEEIKTAFDYIDSLKRGKFTAKDLAKLAEEIGESPDQCPRMVYEADKDQDGCISEEELLRVIKKTSYY